MSIDVSTAEGCIEQAIAFLSEEKAQLAEEFLTEALHFFPLDARLHTIRAVARQAAGDAPGAFTGFWQALAADPKFDGAQMAIAEAALTPQTEAMNKNFALQSGERQTASKVSDIRADHRARYAMAALWLNRHLPNLPAGCGIDVFCGNGYGSRMLADLTGARMLGIDGSSDAVNLAKRHFGSHRVVYSQAFFPFELKPGLLDFAVCFESAEHVKDPAGLIAQLAQATDGPVLVSVPLEEQLPFAVNGPRFEHHTRHFTRQDIFGMLADAGRPVIAASWGQRVYHLKDRQINGLLPVEQMALTPLGDESQFMVVAATRR